MASLLGDSSDPTTAAVSGAHSSTGSGVLGESAVGPGVTGVSQGTDPNQLGVGVLGRAIGTAIFGESKTFMGVFGTSESTTGGHGVMGRATGGGAGVVGESTMGTGVMGRSEGTDPNRLGVGVFGQAIGTAIIGESKTGFGLFATTEGGEAAVRGDHKGGGFGGFFTGNVGVTQDLRVNGNIDALGDIRLIGADLAEDFGVAGGEDLEPGCVVVLAGDDKVRLSGQPYDPMVAGVVSGAGTYRPGLILDRQRGEHRRPLALAGKVWCRVDADWAPVGVGDMLTTSATPGHAMRATDPARAFGAVIGKALASLTKGKALIPILVSLR